MERVTLNYFTMEVDFIWSGYFYDISVMSSITKCLDLEVQASYTNDSNAKHLEFFFLKSSVKKVVLKNFKKFSGKKTVPLSLL